MKRKKKKKTITAGSPRRLPEQLHSFCAPTRPDARSNASSSPNSLFIFARSPPTPSICIVIRLPHFAARRDDALGARAAHLIVCPEARRRCALCCGVRPKRCWRRTQASSMAWRRRLGPGRMPWRVGGIGPSCRRDHVCWCSWELGGCGSHMLQMARSGVVRSWAEGELESDMFVYIYRLPLACGGGRSGGPKKRGQDIRSRLLARVCPNLCTLLQARSDWQGRSVVRVASDRRIRRRQYSRSFRSRWDSIAGLDLCRFLGTRCHTRSNEHRRILSMLLTENLNG